MRDYVYGGGAEEQESHQRNRYMAFSLDTMPPMCIIYAMLRLLIITTMLAPVVVAQDYTWREALDAIRHAETGTHLTGVGVVGDDGHALGSCQIWEAYWIDARMDTGTHRLCLESKVYSAEVVRRYMLRYSKKCANWLLQGVGTLADVERIARIHNGGPKGYSRIATRKFWHKVEIRLALVRKVGIIGSIN